MYAEFSPTCANEFPNDNPALHRGARWVCPEPLSAPRALLRAPAAAPGLGAPASELQGSASAPPVPLTGPLELDLARIVLPHRVQDVPPPPDFIFRPLPSSRRAAPPARLAAVFEPVAAPQRALPLLGYRIVDERLASSRVERRWRVDVAPCVAVAGSLALAAPAPPPPAELQPVEAVELESLAQALFPEFSQPTGVAQLDLLEPVVPGGGEPPSPAPAAPVAAPAAEGEAPRSQKRQRRRAARVASSASLATAALAANAELTRALSEIESAFSERRVEQPRAERKRRGRKVTGKGSSRSAAKKAAAEPGATRRRAANAV